MSVPPVRANGQRVLPNLHILDRAWVVLQSWSPQYSIFVCRNGVTGCTCRRSDACCGPCVPQQVPEGSLGAYNTNFTQVIIACSWSAFVLHLLTAEWVGFPWRVTIIATAALKCTLKGLNPKQAGFQGCLRYCILAEMLQKDLH